MNLTDNVVSDGILFKAYKCNGTKNNVEWNKMRSFVFVKFKTYTGLTP